MKMFNNVVGAVCEQVFMILFVLKLIPVDPVTQWSWWVVTAPLWAGLTVLFVVNFVVALAEDMKGL